MCVCVCTYAWVNNIGMAVMLWAGFVRLKGLYINI